MLFVINMNFAWSLQHDKAFCLLLGKTLHSDDQTGTGGKHGDQGGAKVTTTLKGSMGERINKALHKVEEKKQKRAARRAQVCFTGVTGNGGRENKLLPLLYTSKIELSYNTTLIDSVM